MSVEAARSSDRNYFYFTWIKWVYGAVSPTAFFLAVNIETRQKATRMLTRLWTEHSTTTFNSPWCWVITQVMNININLHRAQSLIHYRHFCIHSNQVESLLFLTCAFLMLINPVWTFFSTSFQRYSIALFILFFTLYILFFLLSNYFCSLQIFLSWLLFFENFFFVYFYFYLQIFSLLILVYA